MSNKTESWEECIAWINKIIEDYKKTKKERG